MGDPTGYIFTWMIAYVSLLGPVGGIMIADYYFVRGTTLAVHDLYQSKGLYTYRNGWNIRAMVALLAGIVPNIPGFLTTIHVLSQDAVPGWVSNVYHYAWFVGFGVSGGVYYFLMKGFKG